MKIIASNFKCNHTRASTESYAKGLEAFLSQKMESKSAKLDISIFPPSSALLCDSFKHFKIGTQNAYPAESGAFTGEIGLEQLSEFNIKRILIGHSERREIGESDEMCLKKFEFFKSQDFKIFFCIGESLDVRQSGLDSTLRFLESQLKGLPLDYEKLVVAYEPIWAIGSGVSASLDDIEATHKGLKQIVGKVPLLYGGSVKAENVREILSIEGVDGVLVGSASWELEGFCQIIENSL
ncbi:MAG: triose-phosphate isomerase [Helicobacteraceae bacterium]|nr:triose-phosphate isomerase [Helicobacteraceae bacterium]